MNNELKQKLEIIIIPILLLEKLPITDYGIAFVAWGVYNKIGSTFFEEEIRSTAEQFVKDHRFCIKVVDQLIHAAQVADETSFIVYATELYQHPECEVIINQMFPKGQI